MKRGPKPKDHALYINDELVCVGTITEIAATMGYIPNTVRRWKTPTFRNRGDQPGRVIELIVVDD